MGALAERLKDEATNKVCVSKESIDEFQFEKIVLEERQRRANDRRDRLDGKLDIVVTAVTKSVVSMPVR